MPPRAPNAKVLAGTTQALRVANRIELTPMPPNEGDMIAQLKNLVSEDSQAGGSYLSEPVDSPKAHNKSGVPKIVGAVLVVVVLIAAAVFAVGSGDAPLDSDSDGQQHTTPVHSNSNAPVGGGSDAPLGPNK